MSGQISYLAGLAAENSVERWYQQQGLTLRARRWRGSAGEIDLVVENGAGLIFVEVKKSKSFASAAERISPHQIARIYNTASEYISGEPCGQNTNMRFDAALVDQQGEIEILENAFGF